MSDFQRGLLGKYNPNRQRSQLDLLLDGITQETPWRRQSSPVTQAASGYSGPPVQLGSAIGSLLPNAPAASSAPAMSGPASNASWEDLWNGVKMLRGGNAGLGHDYTMEGDSIYQVTPSGGGTRIATYNQVVPDTLGWLKQFEAGAIKPNL